MPTKIYAAIVGFGAAFLAACGGGSSVEAPRKTERAGADDNADHDRVESWSGDRNKGNNNYRVEVVLDRAQ